MITVRWQSSDLPVLRTAPSVSFSARTTSQFPANAKLQKVLATGAPSILGLIAWQTLESGGLGTGAKAGIGAGVGVGTLLLLLGVILILLKRRRNGRNEKSSEGYMRTMHMSSPKFH
jgi:hypothetical protein